MMIVAQRYGAVRRVAALTILLALAWAFAGFEWRDVEQSVFINPDGSVVIKDERTLWTRDEDFGEAFICVGHPADVRLTLLDGSGAVSRGPDAIAFQQPCAAGTEVVIRNAHRVTERRVRFVYRLEGTVDVFTDVVQWYWNLIELDHPPINGYSLSVQAPGTMDEPFDAFVMRYGNPETPRVALSEDRSTLTVEFEHIPYGDGVEVRFLMDPRLFTFFGARPGLDELLLDQARVSRGAEAVIPELHTAVGRSDISAVLRLLQSGYDPNTRDQQERTPLMIAAQNARNQTMIEVLIAFGADVFAREEHGFTALHFASASNPNAEVVSALLAAGGDVAAEGAFQFTPLMVAASHNPVAEIIELLLTHGAEPNFAAAYGLTTLMAAARNSTNPRVVAVLLDAGADATAVDAEGQRAIDYARLNPHLRDTPVYWRLNDAAYP